MSTEIRRNGVASKWVAAGGIFVLHPHTRCSRVSQDGTPDTAPDKKEIPTPTANKWHFLYQPRNLRYGRQWVSGERGGGGVVLVSRGREVRCEEQKCGGCDAMEEEEKYDRGSVVRESNLAPADIGMEEEEEGAGAEGDDAK